MELLQFALDQGVRVEGGDRRLQLLDIAVEANDCDTVRALVKAGAQASRADGMEVDACIECGEAVMTGPIGWAGMAAVGQTLYCAPYWASSMLVIDAETKAVRTISSGVEGGNNAHYSGKLRTPNV